MPLTGTCLVLALARPPSRLSSSVRWWVTPSTHSSAQPPPVLAFRPDGETASGRGAFTQSRPFPCAAPDITQPLPGTSKPTDVAAAQWLIPCPDPEAAPLQPPGHPGTCSGNGELRGHCPLLGLEPSLRTSQAPTSSRKIKGIASRGQEAAPHVTGTPSTAGRRGELSARGPSFGES